jgi:hypothetical protein
MARCDGDAARIDHAGQKLFLINRVRNMNPTANGSSTGPTTP